MVWKPDYVTIEGQGGLRDYVTRDGATVDEAFLTIAAGAASRAIDDHTGRQFGWLKRFFGLIWRLQRREQIYVEITPSEG